MSFKYNSSGLVDLLTFNGGSLTDTQLGYIGKVYGASLSRQSTTQSLTSGAWNALQWNSQDIISTGVVHSTSTNPSRIQPTRLGYYLVTGQVNISRSSTVNGFYPDMGLWLNGSAVSSWGSRGCHMLAAGYAFGKWDILGIVYISNSSDYFEVRFNAPEAGWALQPEYSQLKFYWIGSSW